MKQIEITITPEGLRIELIEDKNGTFYQSGSAQLSSSGQELLALLAAELKTLPNQLLIEGHTDATQYSTDANYSNWELSADRANSARRLLQQDGVRRDQVTQVRGFADQMLRVKSNPYDPSNRRITILVKNEDECAAAAVGSRRGGGRRAERSGSGGGGVPHGAQSAELAGGSACQFRDARCGTSQALSSTTGREARNHGQADVDAVRLKEIVTGDKCHGDDAGRWCSLRGESGSVYRRRNFHGHRCRSRFRHTQRSRDFSRQQKGADRDWHRPAIRCTAGERIQITRRNRTPTRWPRWPRQQRMR